MKIIEGGIGAVPGIETSGISAGIKKNGKKDLALIYSHTPAATAGMYTVNQVKAAPVLLCQDRLPSQEIQAIITNSGNANACTGKAGYAAAVELTKNLAERLNLKPAAVLMASTGVIGEPLPAQKIDAAMPSLIENLSQDSQNAATAILTTDLAIKQSAVKINIGGKEITVGGMSKGSGMICPNMATMLAFIATDIKIDTADLQQALKIATEQSFNRITVDGDMSTNDTVLLMANGASQTSIKSDDDKKAFQAALNHVCRELALMIVKDGEGATKFIEINVRKAATENDAKKIALQIANSNLVKTALFAADANWGRIMGAAGAAGVAFDQLKVNLFIGGVQMVKNGISLGKEVEKEVTKTLQQQHILIDLEMNQGIAQATVWGNDLSYDYVKINAEYRT